MTTNLEQPKCPTCNDEKYVHYNYGWKHTGWPCPNCNADEFKESVDAMTVDAAVVRGLIEVLGKPGAE